MAVFSNHTKCPVCGGMMKKRGIFLAIIVFLILIVSVSANKVDNKVEEELEDKEEISVIVMLKDKPVKTLSISDKKISSLENKKIMIKQQQDKVLSSLNLGSINKKPLKNNSLSKSTEQA